MKKAASLLLGLAVVALATSHYGSTASAHSLTAPTVIRPAIIASTLQGRSSISGYVFDSSRRPLADIYVELLDDVYSSLRRARTDAAGRYLFQGLGDGRYKVKVLPYGTDYREEVRDISIINISLMPRSDNSPASGATSEQVDFYLRLKEKVNTNPFVAPPGVIFVQAIPEGARKLYQQGVSALDAKKEKEGFEHLKQSLEIFPEYYDALNRLGTEYVMRGYHEAAFILLTKAIEVNKRGFSSLFGLGIAQYHLKQYDKATESLQSASGIYNKSYELQVYLGKSLRRTGKPDQAEIVFKRANELSQGKAPEVYWQLAALYSEQQRYSEAADALELFLKNQPDTRDAAKIKQSIKVLREKSGTQKVSTR